MANRGQESFRSVTFTERSVTPGVDLGERYVSEVLVDAGSVNGLRQPANWNVWLKVYTHVRHVTRFNPRKRHQLTNGENILKSGGEDEDLPTSLALQDYRYIPANVQESRYASPAC